MEKNSQCSTTWEEKKSENPHPRRKLRRLPFHPLHTNLAQPTNNRLKRQSLNGQYKELSRTHEDIVDMPTELLTDPPWKPDRDADIQIFLSVPGITSKEKLPGELRNLTLALTADRFPHNVWTHVYTDESAEKGMKNGGSGVYIKYPDGDTTSLLVPGGLQCSNYRAEILAICTAAEHLLESRKNMGNIAIFTDSLSTLQLSWSSPDDPGPALLPCQADSSVHSIPPVGACSCGTDRKWNRRQTCKNRLSGSTDTEPCHLQRGQDTSPLSVQWRLEERKRWIPGTPWPNLETGAGPTDHYLQGTAVWAPIWRGLAFQTPPSVSADKLTKPQTTSFSPAQYIPRDVSQHGHRMLIWWPSCGPLLDGWIYGIKRTEDLTCCRSLKKKNCRIWKGMDSAVFWFFIQLWPWMKVKVIQTDIKM